MSVIVDFSIFPMDKGESLSPYVARAVRIVKNSGLPYKFGPMSTSVEGEWDDVFGALERCHEVLHEMGVPRISTNLRLGTRTDKPQTMEDKVKSVEEKLQ